MSQRITNPRGYLKFSDSRVSLEELTAFAEELAQDPNFISVYIRKVSNDQQGVGFIYNKDTSTKESSDEFNDFIKDIAMRKFGTGFVGWDMSNSYILVK